jgi:multidrug efflux pump subunit AcrA (membrane-fusion protein)
MTEPSPTPPERTPAVPLATRSPRSQVVGHPRSLSHRPVDSGLVLRDTTAAEFLPSVRPWVRFAGAFLVGSFAAAVGLMHVWPYRVVVRGAGLVRPSGETSVVNAPFAGRVRKLLVRSNQSVQAGDVLAVLDPADLEGKERQLRQSQQALAEQAEALRRQGRAAEESTVLEIEKAEAALRFAEAEYQRYQRLAGTGSIPAIQLEEKEASYRIAQASLAKARQAVDEQRSRNANEQAQLVQELTTNRAERDQLDRDLRKTAVTAPVSGVIFSINLRNPQQVVAAGEELARIAPSGAALVVKVVVPSQEIDNVEVGQKADLRIGGCPYPDFGTLKARVVSIAPEAQLPGGGSPQDERGSAPTPSGSGGYEVTLQPERTELRSGGRTCQLRQGMDLTADITTRIETVLRFLLRKGRLVTGA